MIFFNSIRSRNLDVIHERLLIFVLRLFRSKHEAPAVLSVYRQAWENAEVHRIKSVQALFAYVFSLIKKNISVMLWDLVLSNRSFAVVVILVPGVIERIFNDAVVVTKSHRSKMADNATKIVDAYDAVVFVEFLILNEIIKI